MCVPCAHEYTLCAHGSQYKYPYVHVSRSVQDVGWLPISLSTYCLEKGPSLNQKLIISARLSELVNSSILPVSIIQCWDYRHLGPSLTFYVGSRDSNSGPHACEPSALIEPSTQPPCKSFKTNFIAVIFAYILNYLLHRKQVLGTHNHCIPALVSTQLQPGVKACTTHGHRFLALVSTRL